MSNYNHSKKAGNYGDVFKHAVLVELVKHLALKKAVGASSRNFPFHYMDTHSGAPMHDLSNSTDWQNGIGKFWELSHQPDDLDYFKYVARTQFGSEKYPSSWLLAYQTLLDAKVANHRISLFDTSADVTKAVQSSSFLSERIKFQCDDAWKNLNKHLEQVDLIFIDPPYSIDKDKGEKASADWGHIMKTSKALLKKGIPFVIWYPYFTEKNPRRLTSSSEGLISLELIAPTAPDNNRAMKGSGMLFGNVDESFIHVLYNKLELPFRRLGILTRHN